MKFLFLLVVIGITGCARDHVTRDGQTGEIAATPRPVVAAPPANLSAERGEQLRTKCLEGRRLICGRVLKVLANGLVVESGYTDLLRPPLTESWLIPGTVPARRNPTTIELNEPATPCIGVVFLTDLPKRPKVKIFDYVVIMGYPAGEATYTPAPNVDKTIRRFAAGLDTAVALRQAEEAGKGSSPRP